MVGVDQLKVAGVGAARGDRGVQHGLRDRGPVGDGEELLVQDGARVDAVTMVERPDQRPTGAPDLRVDETLFLVGDDPRVLVGGPPPVAVGPGMIELRQVRNVVAVSHNSGHLPMVRRNTGVHADPRRWELS